MAKLCTIQHAFTRDLVKLISFAHSQGYEISIGEVLRTEAQQRLYLKQGVTKTLDSYHIKKLAADLHLFKGDVYLYNAESYRFLAAYWESLSPYNEAGFFWGWDANHFERKTQKRRNRLAQVA